MTTPALTDEFTPEQARALRASISQPYADAIKGNDKETIRYYLRMRKSPEYRLWLERQAWDFRCESQTQSDVAIDSNQPTHCHANDGVGMFIGNKAMCPMCRTEERNGR